MLLHLGSFVDLLAVLDSFVEMLQCRVLAQASLHHDQSPACLVSCNNHLQVALCSFLQEWIHKFNGSSLESRETLIDDADLDGAQLSWHTAGLHGSANNQTGIYNKWITKTLGL